MDQKKDKELFYVDLFKRNLPEFPIGGILPDETPDVLVRSNTRCVGIEVTEVFRDVAIAGHPLQKRESELHRIMQKGREFHEQMGLPPVIVRAFFSPHHNFGRADLIPTAKSLAEIVRRNLPDGFGERVKEYDWENRGYFPDTIDMVSVIRQPWLSHNEWAAPEAAWIPRHGPELLQARLDAKRKRYDACKRKCDEVWLLILSGTRGLASIVHFEEGALQREYTTPFDRAFLFEDGRNIIPLITKNK